MNKYCALSVYIDDESSLPLRSVIVDKLFSISNEWLPSPATATLWDFKLGVETEGNWSEAKSLLDQPLSKAQILDIYGPKVSLDEDQVPILEIDSLCAPHVVYNVSLSLDLLPDSFLEAIEPWSLSIYDLFAAFGACIVAIRQDKALPSDRSIDDALSFALYKSANTILVIAPKYIVGQNKIDPLTYSTAELDNGILIKRTAGMELLSQGIV